MQRLEGEITQHLTSGLIPFWHTRARDAKHGGYLVRFDEQGHATPLKEKYLNTQARLVWWFSHLCRQQPKAKGSAALARGGAEFLLNHFWDARHGGWYWKTKPNGGKSDMAKIVYGESFAIYAMAEYTLGTGDKRGLEYASRTFDLLQKFAADTRHGGYYENLCRDWSPEEPGFAGGDRKGLDTHMHLMESFTTLYEASRLPLHRRKLMEVVDLICAHMIDTKRGCGLNQFDMAWNPIPAIAVKRTWNAERFGERPAQPTETTSYGHNLELVWLTHRALEIAGADPKPYEPLLRKLVDNALKHGVDWQYGGIYRDGLRKGGALVKEKEFWQHSESLVGFLDAYAAFRDPRCLDAFECLWDFVNTHMIIHGVGEWRTLLDRRGQSLDPNIGNDWKVSYHSGRAMCECQSRLRRLMKQA
ncbi:MAG: N-acylglucosamine 2-epimerase [Lentisphaerae bacterium]|nr:N-acylglucosamine 2-epimerase [Lentisphaerota bacterium]